MKWFKALYLNHCFFQVVGCTVLTAILGYVFPFLESIARVGMYLVFTLLIVDVLILFRVKRGITGDRVTPDKFSNGDENPIRIYLQNYYRFKVKLKVIDEVPKQFQMRKANFSIDVGPNQKQRIDYQLRPVKRGEYHFGKLNVFAVSPLGFVARRFQFKEPVMVPVYPSFIQMRKFELQAISNSLTLQGVKKIRRIGQNQEFEQIKEYVAGDDFRTINWKATARRTHLMVNTYQDEKAQHIYSLVDKSRVMRMPFEGMSLLDYAINSSLALSNIAIKKGDHAGLITFQHKLQTVVPASKRNNQMQLIQEALYNQKTNYHESDFSRLFVGVKRRLNHRSLLLLYTNFESMAGLERQLSYLTNLAKSHVVVVIFFENTELQDLLSSEPKTVKQIYHKTIAEKFDHEKRLIVRELNKHGIYAVLTPPQDLTVNTINKYLELKARGLI